MQKSFLKFSAPKSLGRHQLLESITYNSLGVSYRQLQAQRRREQMRGNASYYLLHGFSFANSGSDLVISLTDELLVKFGAIRHFLS